MAAVRKSRISATGTWFRWGSRPSIGKRQTGMQSTVDKNLTSTTESPSLKRKRQRGSAKNPSSPVSTEVKTVVAQKPSNLLKSKPRPKNPSLDSLGASVVTTTPALPSWLLRLHTINRYSSIMAFLLVSGSLAAYGMTVYTQELWSQGYHRLQKLQRDERQITATNATLTHKMAEEAEQPSAGLVSPTPSKTIFLSPVPKSSFLAPANPQPNSTQPSSRLGY